MAISVFMAPPRAGLRHRASLLFDECSCANGVKHGRMESSRCCRQPHSDSRRVPRDHNNSTAASTPRHHDRGMLHASPT